MPIRIPVQTIVLHRDGKNFIPEINKPFDFTADELADINNVAPRAIRKPIVEDNTADAVVTEVVADKSGAKVTPADGKSGTNDEL